MSSINYLNNSNGFWYLLLGIYYIIYYYEYFGGGIKTSLRIIGAENLYSAYNRQNSKSATVYTSYNIMYAVKSALCYGQLLSSRNIDIVFVIT